GEAKAHRAAGVAGPAHAVANAGPLRQPTGGAAGVAGPSQAIKSCQHGNYEPGAGAGISIPCEAVAVTELRNQQTQSHGASGIHFTTCEFAGVSSSRQSSENAATVFWQIEPLGSVKRRRKLARGVSKLHTRSFTLEGSVSLAEQNYGNSELGI